MQHERGLPWRCGVLHDMRREPPRAFRAAKACHVGDCLVDFHGRGQGKCIAVDASVRSAERKGDPKEFGVAQAWGRLDEREFG